MPKPTTSAAATSRAARYAPSTAETTVVSTGGQVLYALEAKDAEALGAAIDALASFIQQGTVRLLHYDGSRFAALVGMDATVATTAVEALRKSVSATKREA